MRTHLFSTAKTTSKALFLLILCYFSLTKGSIVVIDGHHSSQTPFFVKPFSTGETTFGNLQPFTPQQTQGIKEIQFCFSWLIPVQPPNSNPDYKRNCHTITPVQDQIIKQNISINLGYNYVDVIVTYNSGWSNVPMNVFVNPNDCPDSKAGPNCAYKAIFGKLYEPMQLQTKEILFIFYPAGYPQSSYAKTFNLDGRNHGKDDFTLGIRSSHVDIFGEIEGTASDELTLTEYSPSFSLTNDPNAGQYWIGTLSNAENVTVTAYLDYCALPGNLTLSDAPTNKDTCNKEPIIIDEVSPMISNIPYKYEGEGEVYFTLKNGKNLNVAMAGNAEPPSLYFDGLRTGLTSGNNFFIVDRYLADWYSTIIGTRFTKNEPIYMWTFTNDTYMCPANCGGICEPGQTLCKCSNGEYSIACAE